MYDYAVIDSGTAKHPVMLENLIREMLKDLLQA
jgi:hypothetical protein